MSFLSRLFRRQRGWSFGTLVVIGVLLVVGRVLEPRGGSDLPEMTTAMPTAKDLVDGKTFTADCYSCARCLNVCPEEAIGYRSVFAKLPKDGDED